MLETIFSAEFGYSVLRVTTPILLAALAALICNRAGVLHIAFEGLMLFAALFGVIGSAYTQSVFIGVLCGIGSAMLLSLLIGFFAFKLRANIVLTGIAINTLASGGTVFLLFLLTGEKGTSNALPSLSVPNVEIPLIKDIPVVGEILSGQNLLTYVALLLVVGVWFLIYKTKFGLRMRAVGENEHAAESVGINVYRTQIISLLIGGLLAGLGGVYMSMGYLPWFSRDMVSGRGFIGIAAQNLGGAAPLPTLIASLIFGIADALSNILQTLRVPAEFVRMIPYVTTLIGLVVYAKIQRRKNKPERKAEKNQDLVPMDE